MWSESVLLTKKKKRKVLNPKSVAQNCSRDFRALREELHCCVFLSVAVEKRVDELEANQGTIKGSMWSI